MGEWTKICPKDLSLKRSPEKPPFTEWAQPKGQRGMNRPPIEKRSFWPITEVICETHLPKETWPNREVVILLADETLFHLLSQGTRRR